ncbi:TolC family protein [Clostridium boliviensis]|uniref:TolC family protein n=1 Tax=Clostridium boliviensis TaxID=318465 RepID=A0ABU4GLP9_9CLOT|nr:TolC family protein [Clostridium boliviensis]MDW2798541.1 TolC family protein [Clostridium boliviensis]
MFNGKKKQFVLILLSAVLLSHSKPAYASPAFSRSDAEWEKLRDNTMEYQEIEDLVHEYNATVLSNQVEYSKQRDDPSADDVARSYRNDAADLRSRITGDDDLSDAMAEAQARSLEKKADDNVFDLEVMRYSNLQTEKNLSIMAQSNMVSYYKSILNLEELKQNEKMLTEKLRVTEVQREIGSSTDVEVLNARNNLKKTEAAIIQTDASISKLRKSLCVMLGWGYQDSPDMRPVPAADPARISIMNPDADYPAAVNNNYERKINQRKLENAVSEVVKDSYRIKIKDIKDKIGTDLDKKYRDVLQAQIAYKEAQSAFEESTSQMEIAYQKKQLGSIGQLEYLQQQTDYEKKQDALKIADMDWFWTMEMYDWSVNGMASVQ